MSLALAGPPAQRVLAPQSIAFVPDSVFAAARIDRSPGSRRSTFGRVVQPAAAGAVEALCLGGRW
jgi:hypothetical protein